tara:strand:+ start:1441 stop:1701 length:261 start_codon:yes stop_codon:yes gene_type:complete
MLGGLVINHRLSKIHSVACSISCCPAKSVAEIDQFVEEARLSQARANPIADCSWDLSLDKIMRCRRWFFNAPQLLGAPAAVLSADQ